jgi:hypothetical protein
VIIERELVKESTLEDFANKHGLVMEVRERSGRYVSNPSTRFYAHFKRCEVKDGCMLGSISGNGPTEEAAIADYGRRISEQHLVFNAYGSDRVDLVAPRIVVAKGLAADQS